MECLFDTRRRRPYWRCLASNSVSWERPGERGGEGGGDGVYDPASKEAQEDAPPEVRSWRRACNSEKRRLHETYACAGGCHLDLCCGRGGDVGKLAGRRPRVVVGVDACAAALEEAARRASSVAFPSHPAFRFFLVDLSAPTSAHLSGKLERYRFSSISVMFALHYLTGGEASLANFAAFLSGIPTAPGGCVLYGIAPDWRFLRDIADRGADEYSPFDGCVVSGLGGLRATGKYSFRLRGCVEGPGGCGVEEHLVRWPSLEPVLEAAGWVLESLRPCEGTGGMYSCFVLRKRVP